MIYEELKTENTCACIKQIPNSNVENAEIKIKGIKPIKNAIKPEAIILYEKPLKILSNMWPLNILAANLRPNETFLAKYDINSINTKSGSKAVGQPSGTKIEKNLSFLDENPNKLDPKTTEKLMKKVKIKCDVKEKL